MLKIKLFQRGKRGQRTYRLVVAEAKSKRDGKFTDSLGFWNPQSNKLEINHSKLESWQKKGALLTEGVRKLINKKA